MWLGDCVGDDKEERSWGWNCMDEIQKWNTCLQVTVKTMIFDSFLGSVEWELCVNGPFTIMGICASEIIQ